MTVEANAPVEQLEVGVSHSGIQDVLVDVIARAGVDEQHVVLNVAVGQSPQPTTSPRHSVSSVGGQSRRTASSACQLAWISEKIAIFKPASRTAADRCGRRGCAEWQPAEPRRTCPGSLPS